MSNFVMSQIKKVNSGEIVISGNFDNDCNRMAVAYDGHPKNVPVNMDKVTTFYTNSIERLTTPSPDSNSVEYPIIVFKDSNDSVITKWYYPPDDGEELRDADFNFLMNNFCTRCPKNRPSAKR